MNKQAADREFADMINVDETQAEAALQAAAPLNVKDDLRRRHNKAKK